MSTHEAQESRHRYRDPKLTDALKAHRAACKEHPEAARTLAGLEARLKQVDKILADWDRHHLRLALQALDAGQPERAAGLAWLIWFDDDRRRVLSQVRMEGAADEAAERAAANRAAGRFLVEGDELDQLEEVAAV